MGRALGWTVKAVQTQLSEMQKKCFVMVFGGLREGMMVWLDAVG